MISNWIYLLPVIPAGVLASEDFRRRRISLIWLVILGICTTTIGVLRDGVVIVALRIGGNMVLTVILFLCIAMWVGIRYRQQIRYIFPRWFGGGDLLLMLVLTPFFAPASFMQLILASSLLALIWWFLFRPRRRRTIPLAGFISLTLISILLYQSCRLWHP